MSHSKPVVLHSKMLVPCTTALRPSPWLTPLRRRPEFQSFEGRLERHSKAAKTASWVPLVVDAPRQGSQYSQQQGDAEDLRKTLDIQIDHAAETQ